MKPFFVSDSVEVYLAPIHAGEEPRHERERAAVAGMVRALFGPNAAIGHDETGAPRLKGQAESISVSHSRLTTAIAIDRKGRALGIDIEQARPQLTRVAPRVLSETEMAGYAATTDGLAMAWTLKEAAYKCAGVPGLDFRSDIELPETPKPGCVVTAAGKTHEILYCGAIGEEFMALVCLK